MRSNEAGQLQKMMQSLYSAPFKLGYFYLIIFIVSQGCDVSLTIVVNWHGGTNLVII